MFRIYANGSCPVGSTAPYNRKTDAVTTVLSGQRYDQVQFSFHLGETEKRVKETVGRLSQEVRARVTTQDVDRLRQQVADGTYQPNAGEIAARMLLVREDG